MYSKKYSFILGCVICTTPSIVWSQIVSPGSVQRNTEQILRPDSINAKQSQDVESNELVSFDKLAKVHVRGDRLVDQITGYWSTYIGKSVAVEEVADFKTWLSNLARDRGFLAYAQTKAEVANDGTESLVIDLVVPTIKSVKVYVPNAELKERYEALLIKRFADVFKPGSSIDLQALDQRLEVVGYDLPVDLEVLVRAAGVEEIDLSINVERVKDQPGDLTNGLLQFNNYGLKAFGRTQVVGSLGGAGLTPKSNMVLTTQLSEGVRYGRAEYEAPVEALHGRIKSWYSLTRSHTILGGLSASKARSREYGFGLSHMLGNFNAYLIKSSLSLSDRKTSNALSVNDQELSSIKDAQIKWNLSVTNDRVSRDFDQLDFFVTAGHYRDVRGDATPAGLYAKLELMAKAQRTLTFDGRLQGVVKLKGQLASQNLDSYNRMALGGMTGVRAYTTADGVGDSGLQATAELNHKLEEGKSMGIFYDAGLIKPNKNPVSGVLNNSYTLQAVGMQWSGSFQRWYYNATLAKGVGRYKKYDVGEATESKSNATRMNLVLSYVF